MGDPRNNVRGSIAVYERELRLHRIDVMLRFTPLEQWDAEIGNTAGTDLSLLFQLFHHGPGILHRRPLLIWLMKLVEIDSLNTETAKRCFTLFADAFGP